MVGGFCFNSVDRLGSSLGGYRVLNRYLLFFIENVIFVVSLLEENEEL